MVTAILVYVIFLLGVGVYTGLKETDYDMFVVAGRRRSRLLVFFSLMATMIGGSATFGIAATGMEIGFPAFWWLGVGTVGLLLQGVLISARVRDFQAYTLADIACMTVGKGARLAICVLIVISWLGVIAGQFVALSQIFAVLTEQGNTEWLLVVAALAVVAFTATGGQLSVMRTDAIQFFVLFVGVLAVFCFLYFGSTPEGIRNGLFSQMEAFNASFTPANLFYLLFVVGGTYFIGPDVLSRSMAAKDGRSARQASLIAAVVLLVFNFLIVGISVWCRDHLTDVQGLNPLVYIMEYRLPTGLSFALGLGLISALLSSASTCLITTASIIQNDVIRKKSMGSIRLIVCGVGILATLIALMKQDIIAILTGAYSIYAPGVVFPLLFAILFYKKRRINEKRWLFAAACGGVCGIAGNFFAAFSWLPLLGMGLSAGLGLWSVFGGKREE